MDLTAAPLVEPERCFVFGDQQIAFAYRSMVLSQANANTINSPVIDLIPGTSVCYNGRILTIVLVGETEILLHTENKQAVELEQATFTQLVREGKITGISSQVGCSASVEIREFLMKASPKDLEKANRRYRIIESCLRGEPVYDSSIPERTLRDWKAKYVQAQQKYGYGYIGLVSYDSVKGNRHRKLPEHTLKLMEEFVSEDYETYKQKPKFEVYGDFVKACFDAGIPNDQIPSYKRAHLAVGGGLVWE